jgi:mitochondrial intermediate peptidase
VAASFRSQPYFIDSLLKRLAAAKQPSSGLYGRADLKKPEDFETAADAAIQRCDELVAELISLSPPSVKSVQLLDLISDTLCRVLDVAEICRQTHADDKWRNAAQRAYSRMAHFLAGLNSNRELFDSVAPLAKTALGKEVLDTESLRVVTLLVDEFERHGGIHLDPQRREHVIAAHQQVEELSTTFLRNLTRTPGTFRVRPKSALKSLPRSLTNLFPPQPPDMDPDEAELPASERLCEGITQRVAHPAVRRTAYVAMHSAHSANVPVLHALAGARHELAVMIGHPSFAHMTLADRMAQNPSTVLKFLHHLSARIKPQAMADRDSLLLQKRRLEAEGVLPKLSDSLDAWDLPFLAEECRMERMAQLFPPEQRSFPQTVSDYLSLKNAVRGLQLILRETFGVDMVEVDTAEGETWGAQHGEVRKLVLRHPSEGELGVIYLDLYAREFKQRGAAQYVIQCGRRIHEFEKNAEETYPGFDEAGLRLSAGGYQKPVVALAMSFPRPSSKSPKEWGQDVSLSLGQLQVMFHEFGHALHSLFNRTTYQHVSGSRSSLDFVELPSHVFERFAQDPRVLERFATHRVTGTPLSSDLVSKFLTLDKMHSSLNLQGQVVSSLLDLAVYSDHPMAIACSYWDQEADEVVIPSSACKPFWEVPSSAYPRSMGSSVPTIRCTGEVPTRDNWKGLPAGADMGMTPRTLNSSAVFREISRRHSVIDYVPGTAWQGGFGHLVNYAAGYYSYLYARAYAAAVWNELFDANPFDRKAGDVYRRDLLAKGGSLSPSSILEGVLGGVPPLEPFLIQEGVLPAPERVV